MSENEANGAGSKIDRVVEAIARAVDRGVLAHGAQLKSLRDAALEYGVSKNTVVEAYDRLVAQGYLTARRGAGFFVAGRMKAVDNPASTRIPEATDIASLLREQLEKTFEVRPGDGRPPSGWVEGSVLKSHLRNVGSGSRGLFEHAYENPAGFEPLRELLAGHLAERFITAPKEQLLLTLGANHGFDLIIRQFLHAGEAVLVDEPGYYPLFAKLKLAGLRMVGVRRLANGPDTDDLAEKARRTGARFFFTQSQAHNPTGGTLDMASAHRVLRIAEELGLLVVEDDIFGDLVPAAAPRLAALDQLQRVIYVSSFAKTLSASLRVGYVAASPDIVEALQTMKMLTIVNSSGYVERIVHAVLVDGHYRHHLKRLAARVGKARLHSVEMLTELGLPPEVSDGDGYYLWVRLPDGVDDIALTREAAAQGIFLAPGSVFSAHPESQAQRFLRLNVAYTDDDRFRRFAARIVAP